MKKKPSKNSVNESTLLVFIKKQRQLFLFMHVYNRKLAINFEMKKMT